MSYLPFYRTAARRLGLTVAQLNALEMLAWSSDSEVPIADLGIPRASVAKLESLGLLETTPKDYASLTPKGLDTKREGERQARIAHRVAELKGGV